MVVHALVCGLQDLHLQHAAVPVATLQHTLPQWKLEPAGFVTRYVLKLVLADVLLMVMVPCAHPPQPSVNSTRIDVGTREQGDKANHSAP